MKDPGYRPPFRGATKSDRVAKEVQRKPDCKNVLRLCLRLPSKHRDNLG